MQTPGKRSGVFLQIPGCNVDYPRTLTKSNRKRRVSFRKTPCVTQTQTHQPFAEYGASYTTKGGDMMLAGLAGVVFGNPTPLKPCENKENILSPHRVGVLFSSKTPKSSVKKNKAVRFSVATPRRNINQHTPFKTRASNGQRRNSLGKSPFFDRLLTPELPRTARKAFSDVNHSNHDVIINQQLPSSQHLSMYTIYNNKNDQENNRPTLMGLKTPQQQMKLPGGVDMDLDGVSPARLMSMLSSNVEKPRHLARDILTPQKTSLNAFHSQPPRNPEIEKCLQQLHAEVDQVAKSELYCTLATLHVGNGDYSSAKGCFHSAVKLQCVNANKWIAVSKKLEEKGRVPDLELAVSVLLNALESINYDSQSLLLRCMKLYERLQDVNGLRALIFNLGDVDIDRMWRPMLEAALIEARMGNTVLARTKLHSLIKLTTRNGSVFYEAAKFEMNNANYADAQKVCEQGLTHLPRYGPLWFLSLRLTQQQNIVTNKVAAARSLVTRALKNLSKDLRWKIFYEAAQIESSAGNFGEAYNMFEKSANLCNDNLKWKVFISQARNELRAAASFNALHHREFQRHTDHARTLLKRAADKVSPRMIGTVLIEQAKLEQFAGRKDDAINLLSCAQKNSKQLWKVYFERVLLEVRGAKYDTALQVVRQALSVQPATGRLWALLIQLTEPEGPQAQMNLFTQAIQKVPKSGEVWIEGARLAMNPTSAFFNLQLARERLQLAIYFTPQYGDSFVECLRLILMSSPMLGPDRTRAAVQHVRRLCVLAHPNYGAQWFANKQVVVSSHCVPTTVAVLDIAERTITAHLQQFSPLYDYALRVRGLPRDIDTSFQMHIQHAPNDEQKLGHAIEKHKYAMFDTTFYSNNFNQHAASAYQQANLHSPRNLHPPLHCITLQESYQFLFGCDPVQP